MYKARQTSPVGKFADPSDKELLEWMVRRELTRRGFIGSGSAMIAGALGLNTLVAACTPFSPPASSSGPTGQVILADTFASLGQSSFTPWLITSNEEVITHIVGETLIRSNPTTRALEPCLAESWLLSQDGTTWTFTLRPNIPFHGGYGSVTAEDVQLSWEQYIRPDTIQGFAGAYRQAVGGDISGFEIVSPLEFRLHAKKPIVTLAALLTNGVVGLVIQSKKYWDAAGDTQASSHPIGTGPFKFVSLTSSQITLEAVGSHWRKTPAFKQLIIRSVPDDATKLAQIESGEVDIAPIPLNLKAEATAAGVRTVSIPAVDCSNIYFGGQYPNDPLGAQNYDVNSPWIQAANPSRGLAIRQALNVAIDRKSIVDKILLGEAELTTCPTCYAPKFPYDDPSWQVPVYDPTMAKALLAQGGYPNGFSVNMPEFSPSGRPETASIGEAVAGMWEAIGLKVNRQPMDFQPTFRAFTAVHHTAGMAYAMTLPYYDEPVLGLTGYIPPGVGAHWFDPVLTAAYLQMQAEPDQTKRYAIARGLGTELIQNVRAIPIAADNGLVVVGKKIKSWSFVKGLAEIHNLEYLST